MYSSLNRIWLWTHHILFKMVRHLYSSLASTSSSSILTLTFFLTLSFQLSIDQPKKFYTSSAWESLLSTTLSVILVTTTVVADIFSLALRPWHWWHQWPLQIASTPLKKQIQNKWIISTQISLHNVPHPQQHNHTPLTFVWISFWSLAAHI